MNTEQIPELEEFYDNQIHAHFAEIRLLREQRNAACSRTKGIPPEILSKIFGILDYTHNLEEVYYPHLWWKAVTHVCHSWRHIALNEPTLWTDFSNVHHKWIPEFFARSKAAPLRLRYDLSRYRRSEEFNFLLDAVVKSPERIKHLHIQSEGPFVNRLIEPAPFLESLEVHETRATFPPDFLGGVAPRLRSVTSNGDLHLGASWLENATRLECRNGRLLLEAGYPSRLTSLHLSWGWDALDATTGGIRCINMDILLSAFENMPLLERLFFGLPVGMDERPCTRSTPVHLHHLRDITVDFNHKVKISEMFDYLRVDNLEKLHTSWRTTDEGTAMVVGPVCRFFEACYHGSNLRYLRKTDNSMEFHRFFDSAAGIGTPVLLFNGFYPTDLASLVDMLPRCAPRTFITHSEYCGLNAFALTDYSSIEEVRISMDNAPLSTSLFELDDTLTLPYPSLRRLHLKGVSFDPNQSRNQPERLRLFGHIFDPNVDQIPQLMGWLAGRKPIVEVVVEDCDFSAMEIESLQVVAVVTTL